MARGFTAASHQPAGQRPTPGPPQPPTSAPTSPAPTAGSYPRDSLLLVLLLLLNHLVAVGELACAVWTGSLGLFSHGSHMVFNGVILTGLTASVLANWEQHKRFSLSYVELVGRLNLAVGCVLLCNASTVGYVTLRNGHSNVRREALVCLVPVPALLLNLVAMYVILHGRDSDAEEPWPEWGPWPRTPEPPSPTPTPSPEQRALERRTAVYVRQHIAANALGSVGTVASSVCVQLLGWAAADAICSGFVVLLMYVCAVLLIRESLEMSSAVPRSSARTRQTPRGTPLSTIISTP